MKVKRILAAMLTMAMLLTSSGFTSIVYADTLVPAADPAMEVIVEEGNQETPALTDGQTVTSEEGTAETPVVDNPELGTEDPAVDGETVDETGTEDGTVVETEAVEEEDAAVEDAEEEALLEDAGLDAYEAYEASPYFSVDGNGVLELDDSAIPNPIDLTVYLPEGVEVIPEGIFNYGSPLEDVTEVVFAEKNALLEIEPHAFESSPITSLELGVNCAVIGTSAFEDSAINSISLQHVRVIGNSAFENTKIKSVDVSNARIIGSKAFAGCTQLASVTWPKTYFDLTSADPDVADPADILGPDPGLGILKADENGDVNVLYDYYIGADAFARCSLQSLAWGDLKPSVYVGKNAFSANEKLTSANLPAGLAAISDSMFADCTKLASLSMKYPQSSNLTTSIGNNAFANCVALVKLEIGLNVRNVGRNAFVGCKNLEEVKFYTPGGDVDIDANAFTENASKTHKITIYSYDGKVKTYVTNTIKEKGYTFVSLYGTYTITGKGSSKGSVTVQAKAQPGDSVDFTIKPADGYALKNLSYVVIGNAESNPTQTVDPKLVSATNSVITLNFEMPDYPVYIVPTFVAREKIVKGNLEWSFDPYDCDISQDRKELTFEHVGYSATLRISDSGDNGAEIAPWNFKMTSDKPEYVSVSALGVISALERGDASITVKAIGTTKNFTLTAHVQEHIVIDEIFFDEESFLDRYSRENYFLNYYPAGDTDEFADEDYPIIELDADVVAESDVLLNMNMIAHSGDGSPNLIVKSSWTTSDKGVAKVVDKSNTDKVTTNSDVITISQGAVGEVLVKFRVDNRYNDLPEFVENGVILRILSPTPRNGKISIEVNKQRQGGTPLKLIEVYGYAIDYSQPFTVHYKETTKGVTTWPEYPGLAATAVKADKQINLIATKGFSIDEGATKVLSDKKQVYIRGALIMKDGTKRYFYTPLQEVIVKNKPLSVSANYIGKLNTFYLDYNDKHEYNYVTINFKTTEQIDWSRKDEIRLCTAANVKVPDPENDKLANNFVMLHEDMEPDCEGVPKDDTKRAAYQLTRGIVVRRTKESLIKNSKGVVNSGYIIVPFVGYTSPVAVKVTIPVYQEKPAYALEKSSVKVSTMYDNAEFQVELWDTKAVKEEDKVVDLSDATLQLNNRYVTTYGAFDETALDAHVDNDKITFKLNGDARTASAVLMVQKPNWHSYVEFTFKTNLVGKPTVTMAKTSVGLNKAAPNQTAEILMKVKQDNVEVTDITNAEYVGSRKKEGVANTGDALAAAISFDGTLSVDELKAGYTGKLVAELPTPVDDLVTGKYKIKITPEVTVGGVSAEVAPVTITITVTNKSPVLSLKTGSFVLNALYGGKGEESLSKTAVTGIPARSKYQLDFSTLSAEGAKTNYPDFDELFTIDFRVDENALAKEDDGTDDDGFVDGNDVGIVSVQLKKKVWSSFKYVYYLSNIGLTVTGDNGNDEYVVDNLKVTITGNAVSPTISLKASGTMSPIAYIDECITYTMKLKGINGHYAQMDPDDPESPYVVKLEEINRKTGQIGPATHFVATIEHLDPEDLDSALVTRVRVNPYTVQTLVDRLNVGATYQLYISYMLKETGEYLPATRLSVVPKDKMPSITQDTNSVKIYAGVTPAKRYDTVFVAKKSRERAYIAETDVYEGLEIPANRVGIGTRIATDATDAVKNAFAIETTTFYRLTTVEIDGNELLMLTTAKVDENGDELDIATYGDFKGVDLNDLEPVTRRIVEACYDEKHQKEEWETMRMQCIQLDEDGIPVLTNKGVVQYGAYVDVYVVKPSLVKMNTSVEVPIEIRYELQNLDTVGKKIKIKAKVMK